MISNNNIARNEYFVIIIALTAVFIPVFLIEMQVLHNTSGIFMYPLDDTFIHLSVAKNLALSGNWGINKYEFASASSSVFYTVLLAICTKIFSASTLTPFIINIIAGFFLIFVLQRWLKKQNLTPLAQLIILLCVIFLTPLPIIIISGMEHTLQCLFSFLFIFSFSEWMEKKDISANEKIKLPWQIFVYGFLVTAIRYEGIFIVAVFCLILLFNKKIVTAFLLGFISVLPILIFGVYSLSKGSYFFPNSVLLKSQTATFSITGIASYVSNILVQKFTVSTTITALSAQRLLIILPLVYLVFLKQIKIKKSYKYALIILISVTLLHLSFAATGWFYRYEAYLIMCAAMIVSVIIYKYWNDIFVEIKTACLIIVLLLFSLSFPMILRSSAAFTKASTACTNIYQQQYQMAQFVNEYYNGKVVAANDIGAISDLSNANILDLWGLGNIDVAKSKKQNYWTPVFLDSFSRKNDTKIAIVYDSWFNADLLKHWQKIATWKISNNVICGDDTVSFYAVDENEKITLKNNLLDFQKKLPAGVEVNYY
jgi:hypothetical protein